MSSRSTLSTTLTPHELLGISPDATFEEARIACRRLSQIHHPDKGGDPEIFRQVVAAREHFRRKIKCSVCNGTGVKETRNGMAVKREPCPACWKSKEPK